MIEKEEDDEEETEEEEKGEGEEQQELSSGNIDLLPTSIQTKNQIAGTRTWTGAIRSVVSSKLLKHLVIFSSKVETKSSRDPLKFSVKLSTIVVVVDAAADVVEGRLSTALGEEEEEEDAEVGVVPGEALPPPPTTALSRAVIERSATSPGAPATGVLEAPVGSLEVSVGVLEAPAELSTAH